MVSGPCLFSNALLCPDLWATVYAAAAAVIVYLFVGAQKNWGRGRSGVHEFVLKII